ncbi:zinc ribbon domain-containing protein [Stieleria varia]|uniref:Putative zinc ribbon domain protein n=1 Tax=Stieleria varia TaxID=2528005 RepID=A0A5C6A257_9BACT|nr:phospholipase [Stieleria varia]TWT93944.1 putative zinc ribbon domain protein [Stieleria varia]
MAIDHRIPVSLELLRQLHHVHKQQAELQGQLDRGPRQIKAGEALVAKASQELESAKQKLKQAKMSCDEKTLQLKSREDGIKSLQVKLNAAKSNREFDTFKEQIAADEQANLVLSDEILEALEKIDELTAAVTAAEQELKQQIAAQEKRVVEVSQRMLVKEEELVLVRERLAKAEKEIPASARPDYDRLVDQRGEEALAPIDLEDESCGGCYQTLTTQLIESVRLQFLIRCPNCNAMLYLAK